MTPEKRHEKHRGTGTSESCWFCQRGRAICRSKRSFPSQLAAELSCLEGNVNRGWQGRLLMEYRCEWCLQWHMRTAGTKDAKKLRRRRRLLDIGIGREP